MQPKGVFMQIRWDGTSVSALKKEVMPVLLADGAKNIAQIIRHVITATIGHM